MPVPRPSGSTYLLGCGLGGIILLVAGVALVSLPAALITAGLCMLATTAMIAYLRGAR